MCEWRKSGGAFPPRVKNKVEAVRRTSAAQTPLPDRLYVQKLTSIKVLSFRAHGYAVRAWECTDIQNRKLSYIVRYMMHTYAMHYP